jgi:hypothetical protein
MRDRGLAIASRLERRSTQVAVLSPSCRLARESCRRLRMRAGFRSAARGMVWAADPGSSEIFTFGWTAPPPPASVFTLTSGVTQLPAAVRLRSCACRHVPQRLSGRPRPSLTRPTRREKCVRDPSQLRARHLERRDQFNGGLPALATSRLCCACLRQESWMSSLLIASSARIAFGLRKYSAPLIQTGRNFGSSSASARNT